MNLIQERFKQESKAMKAYVETLMTRHTQDEEYAKQREAEDKRYQAALQRVRRAAKKDGYRIVQGRNGMGMHGLRMIDIATNAIVKGEHFDLDLETIAGWYGIVV